MTTTTTTIAVFGGVSGGIGCPPLTESALLRTVGAIRAAAADATANAAAAPAGGPGGTARPRPSERKVRREEARRPRKLKKKNGPVDDGRADGDDCGSFYIDR